LVSCFSAHSTAYRVVGQRGVGIAETTDISPKQAKDLTAEHGKEKAKTEAAKFKAES
jgi:hypothetical protein